MNLAVLLSDVLLTTRAFKVHASWTFLSFLPLLPSDLIWIYWLFYRSWYFPPKSSGLQPYLDIIITWGAFKHLNDQNASWTN